MSYLYTILREMRISDIIDIIILAIIFYKIYTMISFTRAIQLLKGIGLILLIFPISNLLNLRMVNFFLRNLVTLGALALVVIFQPELRRALEHMGRSRMGLRIFGSSSGEKYFQSDEIVEAVSKLSKKRIGALIVIENETGLNDIIETGTTLNANITSELLQNIFMPKSPLHDGATIIRFNKIVAAGCLLPLSNDRSVSTELGTRHRAALGMSSQSDAIIIVVSEETGVISLACNGSLNRFIEISTLQEKIEEYYFSKSNKIEFSKLWEAGDKNE